MKSLLIVGCGGHGRVVGDAALEVGYERIAYLDDRPPTIAPPGGSKVIGPISSLRDLNAEWPVAIVAIGDGRIRLQLFEQLQQTGFETPAIVHPAATVSRGAKLGKGVFLAAGSVVNIGTRIGDVSIVNTGARVDHDCTIGRGCHIAPGATLSGNVLTGDRVWLGTGCSVRQDVKIGDDVLVGVGASVVSNLDANHVYAGVPARVLTAHH
ncbi:MAG: acetyltransferase [Aquamicrobium sp.]|jgi:sugar O-acyltransferase (sialic acid O-acetyltransferase NeuD family)|uniref:acetyltransferase n=1 Tax=Mesorhizobium sp. Pch-S TaxID=2082387 RepID=UPI00101266A9|nr:acetyltransferase [Mesorhizobium sp. Pch-S]MBR2687878.1 acetyltransferase [Aquamicrobium sp.]QAZ41781.1 sugar O-acyltransferase [Mesorhizobium sp. Pch-S]